MTQAISENSTAASGDSATGDPHIPTPVTPEDAFRAIGRLRLKAQDEIDRLLAFLDATDGDPNLEPSLGFPEPTYWGQQSGDPSGDDDREGDVLDHEVDDAYHDAGGVMGPVLDQDKRRDQFEADVSAKTLLVAKREQVRARKADRQAAAGRARS